MAFAMFPQQNKLSSTSNGNNKENVELQRNNAAAPPAPTPTSTRAGGGGSGSGSGKFVSEDCCMHLNNLSADNKEEGIRAVCRAYGPVLHIKPIHQRAAIVTFAMPHQVDLAVLKINSDPTLGWQASHKKPKHSSGASAASDSDASVHRARTAAVVAAAASAAPPPLQLQQQPHGDVELNWSQRKFVGPFTQPTAQPMPRGAEARSVALARRPSERLHLYSDDPSVMEEMRRLALAAGGQHATLEYSFHGLTGAGTGGKTYLQPLDPRADGPCSRCQTLATAACEVCGSFYCSVECQRADWPEHRRHCVPMPRLVVTNVTQPQSEPTKPPPTTADHPPRSSTSASAGGKSAATVPRYAPPANNSAVIVTYAVDHRRIFVRSAEPAAAEDYLSTLLAANEAGLAGQPLAGVPERGNLVLARYEQMFYRAVVLNVSAPVANNDDETTGGGGGGVVVDCAYIDFGNKESLPLAALFALPADLAVRPRHPYEVQLAAVPERLCTEAAARLLVDLVDASRVLRLNCCRADGADGGPSEKLERVRAQAPVRLTVPETNECINERLCALNRVEVVALSEDPLWLRELRHAPLAAAVDVQLVVMDNSLMGYNLVSCVRKADHAQLLLHGQRFQEYCGRSRGPYTPRVNELCLARCLDGVWYRASCVEVAGDRRPTLQLIDYGNMVHVSIDDIRKMPMEFAYPLLTFDFMVHGIDAVDPAQLPVLMRHFGIGQTVRADRVETMQDGESVAYVLHSAAVLAKLKSVAADA